MIDKDEEKLYNITMKKYLIKQAIWSILTYSVILLLIAFAIFYAYMDNVLRGYFFA